MLATKEPIQFVREIQVFSSPSSGDKLLAEVSGEMISIWDEFSSPSSGDKLLAIHVEKNKVTENYSSRLLLAEISC